MNSHSDRVVVGYDGSAAAAVAVEWAAAEAKNRGAQLCVIHAADYTVVIPGRLPMEANPLEAAAMGVTAEGVDWAHKIASDLDVEGETHISRVTPALIEASENAALLVVGSRGRGELTGALLGSVAFAVTAHAHCPVVVVRAEAATRPGPDRPVVVGIDAWPHSEAPLRFAASVAAQTGAPLVVVSAYRATYTESGSPALYWALEVDGAVQFERLARQAALDASAAAASAASEAFGELTVRPRAAEGRAARVLCDVAAGCGLLVVGARGEGGFAGLRLGSITHAVLHDAPCPVAVVRDGRDD